MIKNFIKFLSLGLLIQSMSVCAMLLRNSTRLGVNRGVTKPQRRYQPQPVVRFGVPSVAQSTIYHTKNLKVKAAIGKDSYLLKNLISYSASSNQANNYDSLAAFNNELFTMLDNGRISLVMDRDRVSYLLTPAFFGVLKGAKEKGLLNNPSVVNEIVALGQAEYAKITASPEKFDEGKIRSFIATMNQVNKENPLVAPDLEDIYISLRMNPSNNHDRIHYMLGLNRYGAILSEQQLQEFKHILKKDSSTEEMNEYHSADYERFKDTLLKIKTPSEQIKYAHDNFPLAISAIIQEKRNMKLYSPKVIMSENTYENNPSFSTCGESAFRDLFNNLFFDERSQKFEPLIFFPDLNISESVRNFFEHYSTIDTVNDVQKGAQQDFVNLVSDVPGVKYIHHNYEISSLDNEQNLIALCNYFFSLNVANLKELSKALSHEKRTIDFELISGRDRSKKIAITIQDKITGQNKYMYLSFIPGHSSFEVGQENKNKIFLDPKILLAEYSNPESRSLLYIHPEPIIDHIFFRKMQKNSDEFDSSLFYAFPVRDDYEKSRLIRAILLYSKDKKALNYAHFLFDSLTATNKALLKDVISLIEPHVLNDVRIPKE